MIKISKRCHVRIEREKKKLIPKNFSIHSLWSLWLDFINVLRADFTCPDPKCVKLTVKFFVLSGSTSTKAAHKMLVKLTLCHVTLDEYLHVCTQLNSDISVLRDNLRSNKVLEIMHSLTCPWLFEVGIVLFVSRYVLSNVTANFFCKPISRFLLLLKIY